MSIASFFRSLFRRKADSNVTPTSSKPRTGTKWSDDKLKHKWVHKQIAKIKAPGTYWFYPPTTMKVRQAQLTVNRHMHLNFGKGNYSTHRHFLENGRLVIVTTLHVMP